MLLKALRRTSVQTVCKCFFSRCTMLPTSTAHKPHQASGTAHKVSMWPRVHEELTRTT